MTKEITPLMQQYYDIKNKYPETILLFRMGDFFETFEDDAAITAKICGITLTKRNNGAATASPLAGFPHHQLDVYLPKLVKAGCRVAVCEQIEDPKNKTGKIVKREVIEVVTPGVSLYDKLLNSNANNYISAIYLQKRKDKTNFAGIAICDISTGEFVVGEISIEQIPLTLEMYLPSEILFSKLQKNEVEEILNKTNHKPTHTKLEEWIFEKDFSKEKLLRHFQTQNFKGFGINDMDAGIVAAGVVLYYMTETQKSVLAQIHTIRLLNISSFMLLDYSTRRNLEILFTFEGDTHGSLIRLMDKTQTPPGSRLLKKWLNQPLNTLDKIHNRLNCVEKLFTNNELLVNIISLLTNFGDLERLISRISAGKANTRDIVALSYSLEKIPKIIELLQNISTLKNAENSFKKIINNLIPLDELVTLIQTAFLDEPSITFGNGNIFRTKYNDELDSYIQARYSDRQWISDYQNSERNNTNIPSLKVSFNNVFGYYIEVTKVHTSKVPSNYERKQTLTNAERYTTPELKKFETKILNAEFKINEIERRLFDKIKANILQYIEQIQTTAHSIAKLDCLQSFAKFSLLNNYVKPQIDNSLILDIEDGRHPVVETILPPGEKYAPNSTYVDTDTEQIHIITGPNMAGKSCYLRQTALIVLLGQIGCYVPAKKARFGVIDRIFTRVGAQDNITGGESTFLVEMQETAYILNNATKRSLILLDEVGRGTATYDGISIAWAITEYIHNIIQSKTLFATHYHELNELAERYEKIKNYRAEVIETPNSDNNNNENKNNTVIFTHKIVQGASDHSFGIYVGKIAGLPRSIIDRAAEIMSDFEKIGNDNVNLSNSEIEFYDENTINSLSKKHPLKAIKRPKIDDSQLSIFEFRDDALRDKLRNININTITPVQSIQLLEELITMSNK